MRVSISTWKMIHGFSPREWDKGPWKFQFEVEGREVSARHCDYEHNGYWKDAKVDVKVAAKAAEKELGKITRIETI